MSVSWFLKFQFITMEKLDKKVPPIPGEVNAEPLLMELPITILGAPSPLLISQMQKTFHI